MQAPAAAAVRPVGSGAWQMTPCTDGSADSRVSSPVTAAGPPAGSTRWTWHTMPVCSAARAIDRMYQAAPSSPPVGSATASTGGTPRSRRVRATSAACSRSRAAMARPSIRRAAGGVLIR